MTGATRPSILALAARGPHEGPFAHAFRSVCVYKHIDICMYIYIYVLRQYIDRCSHTYVCIHIYIYTYICIEWGWVQNKIEGRMNSGCIQLLITSCMDMKTEPQEILGCFHPHSCPQPSGQLAKEHSTGPDPVGACAAVAKWYVQVREQYNTSAHVHTHIPMLICIYLYIYIYIYV